MKLEAELRQAGDGKWIIVMTVEDGLPCVQESETKVFNSCCPETVFYEAVEKWASQRRRDLLR